MSTEPKIRPVYASEFIPLNLPANLPLSGRTTCQPAVDDFSIDIAYRLPAYAIPNHPVSVLMTPPEYRERINAVLRKLR